MKTSKYIGVSFSVRSTGTTGWIKWSSRFPWFACLIHDNRRWKKCFPTEREAAIQYDKWVLELGLDRPLNILKRQQAA